MAEKGALIPKLPKKEEAPPPTESAEQEEESPLAQRLSDIAESDSATVEAEAEEPKEPAFRLTDIVKDEEDVIPDPALAPEAEVTQAEEVRAPYSEEVDDALYATYLVDVVVFGLGGLFLMARAVQRKQFVQFGPMFGWGALVAVFAATAYVNLVRFTWFVAGEAGEPGLALRSAVWVVAAPTIFVLLGRLVSTHKKDKPLYLAMIVLAPLLFLFLALGAALEVSQTVALVFGLLALLCSMAISLLLFKTLGALSENLTGLLKKGVILCVLVIISGWVFYPLLNLFGYFTENFKLAHLALNVVDLLVLSGITVGLYECVSRRREKIVIKPAFRKPAKSVASVTGASGSRPPTGMSKPSAPVKKPGKPPAKKAVEAPPEKPASRPATKPKSRPSAPPPPKR